MSASLPEEAITILGITLIAFAILVWTRVEEALYAAFIALVVLGAINISYWYLRGVPLRRLYR